MHRFARFRHRRLLVLALVALAALALAGTAAAQAAAPDNSLVGALRAFFSDLKLQSAVVLIVLDFGFGVWSALKQGTFKLSYIADFARNDVAFKLAPWGVLYVGALFAGNQQLVIPGIDLGVAATAFYVAIMAAWAGSLATSLKEIGVPVAADLPKAVAGPENAD